VVQAPPAPPPFEPRPTWPPNVAARRPAPAGEWTAIAIPLAVVAAVGLFGAGVYVGRESAGTAVAPKATGATANARAAVVAAPTVAEVGPTPTPVVPAVASEPSEPEAAPTPIDTTDGGDIEATGYTVAENVRIGSDPIKEMIRERFADHFDMDHWREVEWRRWSEGTVYLRYKTVEGINAPSDYLRVELTAELDKIMYMQINGPNARSVFNSAAPWPD